MKNRYSIYIYPLLLIIDVLIINIVVLSIFEKIHQYYFFNLSLSLFWIITSLITGYYKVYRYTSPFRLVSQLFIQATLFTLGFFAYFGIFKEGVVVNTQFKTLFITIISLAFVKLIFFILIKKYRKHGKNYRKVVFLERDNTSKKIISLFQEKKSLGYTVQGFFSKKPSKNPLYLGLDTEIFDFIIKNNTNEVYATLSVLEKKQLKKLTKFTNENHIQLKLIPNANELYSKNQQVQFYDDTFKVLSIKKLPFDFIENHILKRIFDVLFSFFIILLIMSWLTPLLWIFIKLESKGPLFFKQEREGLNGHHFVCYKFRSMQKNKEADQLHATKNDHRVTKIGAFIRKTSIDELPQFFNVFLGNMSVVGPRPHMRSLAVEYEKEVDNYMDRHAVKPGITGLAQVSGYRGEIKKKNDIKNRVRFDIFYIENWSFYLDVKIIFKTIINVFKGDENAY
ncbi:putative colanic acid biosynthesis UDP-glucose lipid carrier transferase [Tenacibaculum adriaticum]|uniref:Putative colanic acid biosynthesis UDP-glucose lipid carrier transferase n=1 Tax=Tenacibaculum adriaticum TaxID=413713 RepID=A0A5S5DXX9_9FLAO|nr:undecaprenyl-phosphate glucose phosphotransferase [Tenacibaculum adriaticum]TYP99896.1 putative colanic acid biosynthesis UDP-glucose lipid carrier transferase [Tenacibaculum adriaticum]